ncbi:MAG: tetratricopeptide repeat protein [Chloroflexota bacterium]
MGTADEHYDEGGRLYRARDFAAAEQAFRRLLQIVPQSDGKAYGRAAYSLALCLLEQARTDEGREALQVALRADPTLDRARNRLKQLEQQPAPRLRPAPTTRGGTVGVARRVRQGTEPDPIFGQQRNAFIRFRLETSDLRGTRASPTIELRGQLIKGAIEEGDVVEIPGPWRPGDRPSFVLNLTTGEKVRAVLSWWRILQWVILISFLVAFAAFATFVASNMLGGP